jgi:hypothetical protein
MNESHLGNLLIKRSLAPVRRPRLTLIADCRDIATAMTVADHVGYGNCMHLNMVCPSAKGRAGDNYSPWIITELYGNYRVDNLKNGFDGLMTQLHEHMSAFLGDTGWFQLTGNQKKDIK